MGPRDLLIDDLVRQFSGLVRAAAGRVGGARGLQLAEDVAQQVFLNIWRQLEREQSIDDPRSYIYRCAIRETVRLLRIEARQPPTGLDDVSETKVSDDVNSPEIQMVRRDATEGFAAALGSLAPDRRRAVEAHLQGYDVTEIMRMFGWPYQRARNLIARGKSDLRAALAARGING